MPRSQWIPLGARTRLRRTIPQSNPALLAAALPLLTGCASIWHGSEQTITVTSTPPGAAVTANTGESCTTPGQLKLKRNVSHELAASYPGYQPENKKLESHLDGMFFGNLLFGGIPGMLVDWATGSAGKLTPDQVNFNLTPGMTAYAMPFFGPPPPNAPPGGMGSPAGASSTPYAVAPTGPPPAGTAFSGQPR